VRLACVEWPYEEPVGVAIERVASAGFDAIVIDGDPTDDFTSTRAALRRTGIACAGLIGQMVDGRDLISADPGVRRTTQDYLIATVRQTAELGGGYVCLVPGGDGMVQPRATTADEWGWAVEGVGRVAREAASRGVRIGIEPLNRYETNFINRHDQAIALAREVGDGVGVILDTFHMLIEEADPFAAIVATAPWLVDVQVADTNRQRPGAGTYDWPRVFETLDAIGYHGAITCEFVLSEDRTPLSRFRLASSPEAPLVGGHHVPSEVLSAEMREAVRFLTITRASTTELSSRSRP
jgi:sugar phosphate isomerase/epimerase